MVLLGGWVSYVVKDKIYATKAIFEYECIH